jgi:hypothetical protein
MAVFGHGFLRFAAGGAFVRMSRVICGILSLSLEIARVQAFIQPSRFECQLMCSAMKVEMK